MASETSTVQAVKEAITAGVSEAAHSKANDLKPVDTAQVASIINQAVKPIVVNATNNEPWYQSRVTIGIIVTMAIPILSLCGIKADVINADQLTVLLLTAGNLIGGGYALYGRWKAKKPIGSN